MTNFTIEITVPEIFEASDSNGNVVEIRMEKVAEHSDILENLFAYGLKQVINDAAASALAVAYEEETGLSGKDVDIPTRKAWGKDNAAHVADTRQNLREEKALDLEDGTWGTTRATGVKADPMVDARRKIIRNMMAANPSGQVNTAYGKIKMKDKAEQAKRRLAFLDDIAERNAETIDPMARAELDRLSALESITLA